MGNKESLPRWARDGATSTSLTDLLQYASGHYANHTDWSLRHRDAGFTALAAVLTAEFAVTGFAFSTNIRPMIAVVALLTISALLVPLTRLAVQSWTQACKAALEHAALVTKIVWALGLSDVVSMKTTSGLTNTCPFPSDLTFFVPRYMRDAITAKDTDEFVKWNLTKKGTAFQATKWTLLLMGVAALFFGTGSALAIFMLK